MKIPTDREILQVIYDKYYDTFTSFDRENPNRDAKIYVPINVDEVADKLGVDGDIIFGRLYFDMNNRYGFERNGAKVYLFANRLKKDIHCIQFPYMASVLAGLQLEQRRNRRTNIISWVSLFIAGLSLIVSIFL